MSVPTREVTEQLVSSADLTEDEYYRLLSDERRRITMQVLTERELPLTVGELAEEVAAYETGDDGPTPPAKDVRADLHHVHLPLLDDYDVVEYDWRANRVRS